MHEPDNTPPKALEFFRTSFLEFEAGMGAGPATLDDFEKLAREDAEIPLDVSRNMLNLAYAMMNIAGTLVRLRQHETGVTPAQTFDYLEHVFSPK